MPNPPCLCAIERALYATHRLRSNGGYGSGCGIVSLMVPDSGASTRLALTSRISFLFEARLVIELDGSQLGEDHERRVDERRTQYLESLGYRVLRFWNEQVFNNIDGVLETIVQHL